VAIAHNKAKERAAAPRHEYLSDDDGGRQSRIPRNNPETTWEPEGARGGALCRRADQAPAAQREVIEPRLLHHKSVEEVAQIVGVQTSTVKTRMFYARSAWRQMLSQAGITHAARETMTARGMFAAGLSLPAKR